jgi:ankyrin repeat protein
MKTKIYFILLLFFPPHSIYSEPISFEACAKDVSISCIQSLLDADMDVNTIDSAERNLLIHSCIQNKFWEVQYLLDKNINVNQKDEDGHSSLSFASSFGYTNIIKLLVKKNADINSFSYCWWTPIFWSALRGDKQTVEFYKQRGAIKNILVEGNLSVESILQMTAEEKRMFIQNYPCFTVIRNTIFRKEE